MAARPTWKGFLKLSLISVPVRAYNAAAAGHGEIHFHQVHAQCGNRIHHQKVCPVHGEVTNEELVSGYEHAHGQFILIEPEELDQLRTESDKAITIQAFIHPDGLDPLYYSGRNLYLVPDGPAGQKPFAVLHRVMVEHNRLAIAQVVFAGHEETVLLRPLESLLLMTILNYESQLKKPSAFEDEVAATEISSEEMKLASSLVANFTAKDFDFSVYKDRYTERVTRLLEAKAAGRKIPPRPREEAPEVVNLMDALRKSLEHAPKQDAHKKKAALQKGAKTTRKKTS
jgi:DNA end-binding protein Ku